MTQQEEHPGMEHEERRCECALLGLLQHGNYIDASIYNASPVDGTVWYESHMKKEHPHGFTKGGTICKTSV
eukprot:15348522-Ditylum_brightwellii.AAC.1